MTIEHARQFCKTAHNWWEAARLDGLNMMIKITLSSGKEVEISGEEFDSYNGDGSDLGEIGFNDYDPILGHQHLAYIASEHIAMCEIFTWDKNESLGLAES